MYVRDNFESFQHCRLITQEAPSRLRLPQTKSIQEISGVSDIRDTKLRLQSNIVQRHHSTRTRLDVKGFWEIEEYTQNKSIMSDVEKQCELHFVKNTVFAPNGRVKVRLPFKNSVEQLGKSFDIARRRFTYLEKRFKKDKVL